MKIDMHVHSKYSPDSWNDSKRIIKYAKKANLDGIVLLDHNSIEGYKKMKNEIKKSGIEVFAGEEIRTEFGEIGAFFIEEEIKSKTKMEIIDEIHDQDGIVFLPHPYDKWRGFKKINEIIKKIDVVEVFNSRIHNKISNEKAKKLAKKYKKGMCAGSDAHIWYEIGNAYVECDDPLKDVKKGNVQIVGKEAKLWVHGFSRLAHLTKVMRLRKF